MHIDDTYVSMKVYVIQLSYASLHLSYIRYAMLADLYEFTIYVYTYH